MKSIVFTIALLMCVAACKRRPGQVPSHGDIQWNHSAMEVTASTEVVPEPALELHSNEPQKQAQSSTIPGAIVEISTASPIQVKSIPANAKKHKALFAKPQKTMRESKEIPSALSNALWMMGFGLLGMLLMVLLFAFFDTSVLFVLFGIVFLVGFISFLMFKMNHKTKIQN